MILRLCVVIPVFDNPGTIRDVVTRTLAACPFPVLVVDDGSARPVRELLQASDRVEILRLDQNSGKGIALRRAIDWCVGRGFTHLMAIDADGQHFPEDIPLLAEAVRKDPWNLVIGERRMDASAPGISHFGKSFSNFWVRYQADFPVTDSQSGFRAYPLFFLQTMRFFTRRYDFEIEVLVRLLWRGCAVTQVPVRVLYQPPGERVSHFRKLRDNARISLLNTLLVALSLCQRHREPLPASLAVGLGVFVGCTPLFGLHTGIVILIAVLLRLNAVLLWLGSQISIPPLAPLLAFASLYLGSRILHRTVSLPDLAHVIPFARDSFVPWLVGSVALGVLLGAASGLLTYAFTRRRPNQVHWRQNRGGRAGNGFLMFVLRRLGLGAGYFCLAFVYPYFYFFAPTARYALSEYWRIREPRLSWLRRQLRILQHLRAFARTLMDKVYRNYLGASSGFTFTSDGFERVKNAFSRGTGTLLVGAHAGAPDLAATSIQTHGTGARIHTLQHAAEQYSINRIAGEKENSKVDVIYVSDSDPAIYRIHALLRNGEVLGLMADRPLDHNFELVPFLGKLAPIATSPFRIALTTGAELVFIFGFKGKGMGYQFFARSSPPPPAGSSREAACFHYASEYARLLEEFLTTYPEQWFNLYPFFSRQPALPNGTLCTAKNPRFVEELNVKSVAAPEAKRPSATP